MFGSACHLYIRPQRSQSFSTSVSRLPKVQQTAWKQSWDNREALDIKRIFQLLLKLAMSLTTKQELRLRCQGHQRRLSHLIDWHGFKEKCVTDENSFILLQDKVRVQPLSHLYVSLFQWNTIGDILRNVLCLVVLCSVYCILFCVLLMKVIKIWNGIRMCI